MENGNPISTEDFEKVFKEIQAKSINNDKAIVMMPNGSGFDVFKVDAIIVKAAVFYNRPKDLNKVKPVINEKNNN